VFDALLDDAEALTDLFDVDEGAVEAVAVLAGRTV